VKAAVIPIGRIKPSEVNPRFEPRELEGLTQSIRQYGILEPLLVRAIPGDREHVELVAGSRRLAAARLARLSEVPVVFMAAMTIPDQRVLSLTENLHRLDMTPIEKGETYLQIARERGINQTEVAKLCSVSPSEVSNFIGLVRRACPELREAAHLGTVPLYVAMELVKLPHERQQARLASRKTKHKTGQERVRNSATSGYEQYSVNLGRARSAFLNEDWETAVEYLEKAVAMCERRLA